MQGVSRQNVDLETLFLIGSSLFALWILIGSLSFSETARLYPFYTSLGVIILASLLLFQKHAPVAVRKRLSRGDDTEASFFDQDTQATTEEQDEVNERSVGIMALIFGGYIVAVNVVGFLIASMALIYFVQRYYDYGSQVSRLVSAVLVGVFVYGGYIILNVDLDQGMIWSWIL